MSDELYENEFGFDAINLNSFPINHNYTFIPNPPLNPPINVFGGWNGNVGTSLGANPHMVNQNSENLEKRIKELEEKIEILMKWKNLWDWGEENLEK